jgi:methyl-accepting chemotaxis protein
MSEPELADLQAFKSAGWDVRASYGSQCSLLRPLVASGKALEPVQWRSLGEVRGLSTAGLKELSQLSARPGVGSELVHKIGVMKEQVGAANAQLDALIGKLGAAANPVMPAAEFTKLCNSPFQAIIDGVTQSLDDMVAVTQGKLSAAWLKLGMVSALLIALLGVCVVALRGIRRRVSRPLIELKAALDVMQQGNFSQTIPAAPSPDEIGALSGALETYRENAQALEKNRRDRELTMLADAEQAQKVQGLLSEVSTIVASARNGDFSGHADTGDMQGPLKELVEGINEINAVVDSATTEFAGALQAIAGGDLTSRVETGYRGRFADLKAAINETVDRLSQTVATIQVTAADVGLAAREINMGADDLSKRTEEQASSLEETAATTEELAASVKASAQGSKDAARIADDAMQAAENGGAIAGQAVEAMARIESASQKISDIIRVIDDIAFQTNLLALNAAVEAARAGDAGKGFAVVASEVRTLAQRSSDAAKDISTLISSSNGEVEQGVKLVRQAGEQLAHILQASQKVASTIAEISAASGEQANGIDEMSQAVAHLDEMTQQNAALAEQSAASAGALSGRIGQLNDLVAQFRTGREAQGQQGQAYAAPAASTEPARLRQLAQAAFARTRAQAPRPAARLEAAVPAPAPAKKVANSRADASGWEEF